MVTNFSTNLPQQSAQSNYDNATNDITSRPG